MRRLSDVHRIEFSIDWPPGHAAAYLVDGAAPVLVDAGIPDERGSRELAAGLDEWGYDVADVAHVVVTHPHSDHLGQVPAVRDAGATVHAPRRVCEQVERDPGDLEATVRETARATGLPADLVAEQVDRALDSLRRNRRLLAPDRVDERFDYDDTVSVGGLDFEPIHTPGHQVYHACLAVDVADGRALFSGDALIESFRAAALNVGFDRGAYDAFRAFERAMDRLAGESADRVFPGHGPVFTDLDGAIADTRADLERVAADTERAVDAVGPATPCEIVEERYGELRTDAVFLDTLGALGALDADGRVTFDVADGVRHYRRSA